MGKKKRSKSGNPGAASAQTFAEVKPVTAVAQSTYSVNSVKSSSASFYNNSWFEWLVISVASVLSYWYLTARLVGVNVSVLIDEYSYVLDAHHRNLDETAYPNHLFQLVFGVTKQCGADFYSCARSLNAIFVIAGAIFVYLLARHVSGRKWLGSVAAIAAILGSYGTYAAYFMPESIFNFPMLVFYWALIRFGKSDNLLAWAGFGTILGIASLAKPHAFFVIPALVIFIVLWTRGTRAKFIGASIARLAAFGSALLATKFGVGYLIAGEKALSIFGSYGGAISTGEAVATTLGTNTWLNVPQTSWGQTLMITMVLGIALPVTVLGFLEIFKRNELVAEANRVRALVGISLLNMMAVVAVFEAWQNLTIWMHTRYYSYLIPLALVALIEAYARSSIEPRLLLKRTVVGIFLIVSLVALFTAAIPFGANWIDAPDFKFHIDNLVLSSILITFSISLAIWWLWDNKRPIVVAIAIALIASVFSGTHISNFLSSSFGQDTTNDQLGRFLRNNIPEDQLNKTVLVGDNNTAIERALFGSLSGGATGLVAKPTGFNLSELPNGTVWLVKVGNPVIQDLPEPLVLANGYSLHAKGPDAKLSSAESEFESTTNACKEKMNENWSCGSSAKIGVRGVFPVSAEIDLVLEVSESVAKKKFDFVLGDSILSGTLPQGLFALTLDFTNSEETEYLEIIANNQRGEVDSGEERFIRVVSAIVNR